MHLEVTRSTQSKGSQTQWESSMAHCRIPLHQPDMAGKIQYFPQVLMYKWWTFHCHVVQITRSFAICCKLLLYQQMLRKKVSESLVRPSTPHLHQSAKNRHKCSVFASVQAPSGHARSKTIKCSALRAALL